MSPRCPICTKAVAPRAENPAFPFCSPRCKLLDLDRWLSGAYRIPAGPAGDGAGGGEEEEP